MSFTAFVVDVYVLYLVSMCMCNMACLCTLWVRMWCGAVQMKRMRSYDALRGGGYASVKEMVEQRMGTGKNGGGREKSMYVKKGRTWRDSGSVSTKWFSPSRSRL